MITILISAGAAILSSYTLYLLLLTFAASRVKRLPVDDYKPKSRLAIVIPAHNEENGVEETIKSVLQCNYPQELFDCWVIADNCTDATESVAKKSGAQVITRVNTNLKGKGYALQFGFNHLLEKHPAYDGLLVIDADSRVEPDCLSVAGFYLQEEKTKVVQLNDMIEPGKGSWSSESIRTGFILYNYIRPLGKRFFGLSAGLRGNGMVFSRSVLQEYPWNAFSLAEDLEYGLHLLANGEVVKFAPESTVWAKSVSSADQSASQRRRWEVGRYPVVKKYIPILLRLSVQRRSWRYVDALIDLTMPPLVNLMMILSGLWIVLVLGYLLSWISWIPLAIVSAGIIAGLAHFIVGLMVYPQAGVSVGFILKGLPRYAMWKAALYVKMIFKGSEKQWVRTPRE